MGKKSKLREERRRELEDRAAALLKPHAHRSKLAGGLRAPARYDDFSPQLRDKVETLRGHALRDPADWRCRIKSQADHKRFIDLVRFCFAHYRVPAHLEQVWLESVEDDFVDRVTAPDRHAIGRAGAPDLRRWYLIAAQGGSLYKQEAHPWLSKQECHHFLTAPAEITSPRLAMWYAVARAQSDSKDAALKVARSKIAGYSIASTWWKEAARFFARNPIALHEIDDLADFLIVAKQQDAAFTLKGRTLVTLRRRTEDWHRSLRRSQAMMGGNWIGSPLPDIDYTTGKEHHQAVWRFRQIKTGDGLFCEGQRMHHCVAGYRFACMQGNVSIWSLSSEFPIGTVNRGVTMEVMKDGRIVQCRGFANRLPYANEVTMVKRWASEHGLTWASPER
jgi:hypothetical protein